MVTPALLRDWPLPSWAGRNDSKYSRGRVLVVGGATATPGGVQLAGLAALRIGAGHLTLAVAEPVAAALAVAVPEAGVLALPVDDRGAVLGSGTERLGEELGRADAVLIGPGLDDLDQAAELLGWAVPRLGPETALVLDAYALGALPRRIASLTLPGGRTVLTPNSSELDVLLDGDDASEGSVSGSAESAPSADRAATRYGAVISAGGQVAHPDGRTWEIEAGAVVGILAGGASPEQAAVWANYVHASAGDRLAARVGRLGFLAREIIDELPAVLVQLQS